MDEIRHKIWAEIDRLRFDLTYDVRQHESMNHFRHNIQVVDRYESMEYLLQIKYRTEGALQRR